MLLECFNEPFGPFDDVVFQHAAAQGAHAAASLASWHFGGTHHCLFHALIVVRVDHHGVPEFIGGAGDPPQKETPVSADRPGYVFFRPQVPATAGGGNEDEAGAKAHGRHTCVYRGRLEIVDACG